MSPSILPNGTPRTQATPALSAALLTRRVAIYCRVSTEEQREAQTIDTQVEHAQKWVDAEGRAGRPVAIHDWYKDDGVSGYGVPFAHRPAGQKLLADAAAGKFDLLLVYKTDRLGRQSLDIMNAVHDLVQHGVAVKSLTEPFELSTSTGNYLFGMLAVQAGFARDSQLERMLDGKNHWAREGKWPGGSAPYGYVVVGVKKASCLVVSETLIEGLPFSTAEVMRMIYRWVADDGWSCLRVAAQLNAMGVPTASTLAGRTQQGDPTGPSGLWLANGVRNLVVRTTYKGEYLYGKRSAKNRNVMVIPVPPIVDADTWERAQQTLTRNRFLPSPNATRPYLLRGLITCGLCGTHFSGRQDHRPNGRVAVYYVCGGKHSARGRIRGRCPSRYLPAQELEDQIWQMLVDYVKNPGPVLAQLAEHMQSRQDQAADLETERRALALAQSSINEQKDTVVTLHRRQVIDEPALLRQLAAIDAEEADITARLQALEARLKDQVAMADKLTEARELLTHWCDTLEEQPSWERQRALVEGLVLGIEVHPPADPTQTIPDVVVTYVFSGEKTCTHPRTMYRECRSH